MNLYRIATFRQIITIGSYSLNLAELALTCMYIIALFTWTFINTTNVAGDKLDKRYWNNRAGALVASQFPFVTALGTKNNVISLITGVSFEKLNYLHRMVARVIFVLLCVHAGSRTEIGFAKFMDRPWMHLGITSGFAFLLLCVVSLRPIRANSYELFFYTHFVLVLLLLVGAYYHTRAFKFHVFVWPSFVIWGLDRLVRGLRLLVYNHSYFGFGRGAKRLDASVELLSPKLVRLSLKRPPHFHWSPGQMAFLILPDVSALPFEAHPFTIASFDSGLSKVEMATKSQTTPENLTTNSTFATQSLWKELVFLVSVQEGLTKRLAEQAAEGNTVKAYVDGPQAHGGAGVSFTLPLLLNVIEEVRQGRSHCQRAAFLWCIRASDDIQWISEALCNALLLVPQSLEVTIDIFITRSGADIPVSGLNYRSGSNSPEEITPASPKDLAKELTTSTASLHRLRGVRISNGRPDLSAYLQELGDLTRGGHMSVSVCGSQSIASTVRGALSFNSVAGPRNVLKGGATVTLHVETYGYA
ncbi:ferric-chelate reductase [Marasmius sp. AFHP31]|nr:ferric-chelate reductase [Marasmius sp. AFHP31]